MPPHNVLALFSANRRKEPVGRGNRLKDMMIGLMEGVTQKLFSHQLSVVGGGRGCSQGV